MKKILSVLLTIATLTTFLSIFTSCSKTEDKTPAQTDAATETKRIIKADPLSQEEAEELIPSIADLTVDLFKRSFYQNFYENGEQNTLLSPLSVMLALCMTANGADGDTLTEMEAVLGGGLSIADLNRLLSSYANNLPSEKGSKLNIANSIWVRDREDESFIFNTAFADINSRYYGAELRRSEFDENTVKEINGWVSRNTDNMINRIIDEISQDAIVHIINAVVFDADWKHQYTPYNVRNRNFTAFDGDTQNTEFMYSKEQLYIEAENATGFIKPYKNEHYSFAALLPNEDTSITDFIAEMNGENLITALNSAYTPTDGVETGLPKFNFEYETVMNDLLSAMGMPSAFDLTISDFSRLGQSERGNIVINKVLHKTFIEVDELGTKAAAETDIEVADELSDDESEPKFVILDRPFVFAIIDNSTNLPIFIGTLLEIPNAVFNETANTSPTIRQ
jgi:serpin B